MFISSTNPNALDQSPRPLHIRTSSSLKNKYRIGEIGEPWGIPLWTGHKFDSSKIIWIVLCLSWRKLSTQLTIQVGTLYRWRMWSSQGWETWSNAPVISRQSILATYWFPQFQTVCICSVSRSREVIVSLLEWAPIWNFGSRLWLSARVESREATIRSRAKDWNKGLTFREQAFFEVLNN